MKKTKVLSIVLTVMIVISIMSIFCIPTYAYYNYLFPVNDGYLAFYYGYTESYGEWHTGIDIHSRGDDYIYAAYSGTVAVATDPCGHISDPSNCNHYNTYGNYIRIDQDDGNSAYYGHLLKGGLLVSVGQYVTKGQPIAIMGSSGYSTGKHLHFEVRSGGSTINVNPTANGGSIRYSYSGYVSSAPTVSKLTTDKLCYAVDETVTFSATANGTLNTLWIYCPDDSQLYYENIGTSFQLGFGMSGHFQALVQTWNGVGNLCSEKIDFYVGMPHTISYNSNGGQGSMSSQTVKYKQQFTLRKNVFTKTDYKFVGWHLKNSDNKWFVINVGWCTEKEISKNGYEKHIYKDQLKDNINEGWTAKPSDTFTFYAVWEYSHTHTYTNYTYNNDATHKANGTETGKCSCGATSTRTKAGTKINSHIFSYYTYNNDATCASDGTSTAKCTVLGCTSTDTVVATGTKTNNHSFGNYISDNNATTTLDGTKTRTCSVCGHKETVTDVGSKLPTPTQHTHKFTNACDTTCDCGYTRTTTHSFGEYVYNGDASEKADGTKTRTCSVCGHTETVTAVGTKWQSAFTDIKTKDFYYKPTLWAVANNITTGTSKTTFSPNDACTRGQIVTFLWRAAGCPEPTTTNMPFTDVKSSAFYRKAVLWAVENGITSGTSKTTFSPNDPCTRGQIATFLWRAKDRPAPTSTDMPFGDVEQKGFYYKAVQWAVENKITSGTSKTTFAPSESCTRGQIVTFLYRAYN